MGGKNMQYITGPLQIAAGAAGEYFMPGNPISTSLIGGGIGQTAGGAIGGSQGGMLGELLGGATGALGGSMSGLGGPLSGIMGPGTSTGEGVRSMLGMGPSSDQQLLNLASGQYGAGPGGADPLIAQGAGDLATYEGIPNAPGYAPVPGQAPLPTAAAQAAAPSSSSSSDLLKNAQPAISAISGGGTQQPAPPPPPAFKKPIEQAPVAPKGQAPATSITPTVSQVPQPQTVGGRTTQDAYRKLIESLTSGGMGVG